jgi:hypothetical protein
MKHESDIPIIRDHSCALVDNFLLTVFAAKSHFDPMRAADNPFSVDRIHQLRYQPRGWDWDQLISRLEILRFRAAIVGPEGSGKTTLMEDLAERLLNRGLKPRFAMLTRQDRRVDLQLLHWLDHQAGPTDLLCFDGCEQLGPFRWRWLRHRCRRLGGLLITTHSPGRLPTLVQCDTDPLLLMGLIRQLQPDLKFSLEDAGELLNQHNGNIRLALRALYDRWWQRQDQVRDGPSRDGARQI